MVIFLFSACSFSNDEFSTQPLTNNGKKWRIGYFEGGPFAGYPKTLKSLIQGLAELGWLGETQFPDLEDKTDTKKLWLWISKNVESPYLEFVTDAYWSSNWDKGNLRLETKKEVIQRLNQKQDLDIMIAMGTWAGKDLANYQHSVPIVVVAARNPVLSGIIKSREESGFDHIHARVDPNRYERQVRKFHDIFNFKRLGIVYDKYTPSGRNYAGIEQIEKVAVERQFKIVSCNAPSVQVPIGYAERAAIECYKELAPKVDAVYLTEHRGLTKRSVQKILPPLILYKVPSFSQSISMAARQGVLMGNANTVYQPVGRFYAKIIANIFNGASPGDLPLVFNDPLRLAINMNTAKKIGYEPNQMITKSIDEVYE